MFFAAADFILITRHIHNWVSFLLWPSCFTLSGAISSSPLLFPSSILDTFRSGRLFFQCHIFLSFCTVHEVLRAAYSGVLPFLPPLDHVLSELSAMTSPSWVALHGMAHSFTELCKPLQHDEAVILEGVLQMNSILLFVYMYTCVNSSISIHLLMNP